MRITLACVLAAVTIASVAGQQRSSSQVTIQDLRDGLKGYAALRAFDPITGKQKWEYRYPPSDFGLTGVSRPRPNAGIGLAGGVTSTASGLIFTGDNEGNFIAFDSRTGKPLWHYQTGAPVWGSAAITYMLDGRQHVLISAGLTLTDFAIPDAPQR